MCILDLCMLCIYVERCFESLICCLYLCLSSLLVAFISTCFSLLWKTPFIQAQQLLDRSSIDPWSIEENFWALCLADRSSIDSFLSSFLSSASIETSIDLRSIVENFWALYLANRFWIHRSDFVVDKSTTNSFLLRFSARQILRSIELQFLFKGWARIRSHFSHSLSTENLFLSSQTLLFHSYLSTHMIFG